jgi:hypothetical protein
VKFYCAERFEEVGNCLRWCGERARELNQSHATNEQRGSGDPMAIPGSKGDKPKETT